MDFNTHHVTNVHLMLISNSDRICASSNLVLPISSLLLSLIPNLVLMSGHLLSKISFYIVLMLTKLLILF